MPFAILGAEYVLRLLPRGTHDWTKFVRPAELAGYTFESPSIVECEIRSTCSRTLGSRSTRI